MGFVDTAHSNIRVRNEEKKNKTQEIWTRNEEVMQVAVMVATKVATIIQCFQNCVVWSQLRSRPQNLVRHFVV